MFTATQLAFLSGILVSVLPMYYLAHKYYTKGLNVGRRQGFERGLKENISKQAKQMIEQLKKDNPGITADDIKEIKVVNLDELGSMPKKERDNLIARLQKDNPDRNVAQDFEDILQGKTPAGMTKVKKDTSKLH